MTRQAAAEVGRGGGGGGSRLWELEMQHVIATLRCDAVRSHSALRLMAQRRGLFAQEGRPPAFLVLDRQVKLAVRSDVRNDIVSRVRGSRVNFLNPGSTLSSIPSINPVTPPAHLTIGSSPLL